MINLLDLVKRVVGYGLPDLWNRVVDGTCRGLIGRCVIFDGVLHLVCRFN